MDPLALMDFLGFSVGEVERAFLILARISGLFLSAPVLSRSVGPERVKAALIMATTAVMFPLVAPWSGEGSGNAMSVVSAGVTEVLIGAIVGMLVHWVLVATQVAGSVMGFQMGLSMAMVMDPTSGLQEGVLSNLLYLLGLSIFLSIGGHHLLLEGIGRSFQTLPLGRGLPPSEHLLQSATAALAHMAELALLISAPIIGVTNLLYIGMGLINRASPQIQVFFLAMPIAQMIGFVVLGSTLVIFGQVIIREMDTFFSLAFKTVGF